MLPKVVLHRNLSIAEGKEIAPCHLDPCTIRTRPREGPLRHTPVAADEVSGPSPVGVRKRRKDLAESLPYLLLPLIACPADGRPGTCLEHAVLAHEAHELVDIVPLPCIRERVEDFRGDRGPLPYHSRR